MTDLARYVTTCSVVVGILAFLLLFAVRFKANKTSTLEDLFVVALGGSSLPTGVVLVYCAFDPGSISNLGGLEVHVALAGLALLFVSIKSIKEKL